MDDAGGRSSSNCWRTPIPGHAHFVGLAGSGMRALAAAVSGLGWRVSGSDILPTVRELVAAGYQVHVGHGAKNLADNVNLVVYSDAAEENVEVEQARRRGILTLSYAAALGQLTTGCELLAVAGTHGKSTTAAMLAEILIVAGRDPTVVIGVQSVGCKELRHGGRAGRSNLAIAEACEYRSNFLHLRPASAAITGIEPDHFDCFDDAQQLETAFASFIMRLLAGGRLFVNGHCPIARKIVAYAPCSVETYGFAPENAWRAVNLSEKSGVHEFTLVHRHRSLGNVQLQVAGRYNVANALAAAALAIDQGMTPQDVIQGLSNFRGLRRRLEFKGTSSGIHLLDDYAHHPTEVAAALRTVRQMFPGQRVVCLFQPHQVIRITRLMQDFSRSLAGADVVGVAEVYAAREQDCDTMMPAQKLTRLLAADGTETLEPGDLSALRRRAQAVCRRGDVLVTMGAGNIGGLLDAF